MEHVYVDEPREYGAFQINPSARKYGSKWCHLWCDRGFEKDLHEVAEAIGLKRSWYQSKSNFSHYDIVPTKRAEAIKAGATPMNVKEWAKNFLEKWHQEHDE